MSANDYKNAIETSGRQFDAHALRKSELAKLKKGPRPDGIVFIGMGGSGLAGDIVSMLAQDIRLPVPIAVWRSYHLPKAPFKHPFYIFSSFSGNTEETVSGFTDLLAGNKKGFLLAATGTGGILKELADEYRIPFVAFPKAGLTPRGALGYSTRSVITILKTRFPSLRATKAFPGNLEPSRFETEGKKIAAFCRNKPVVIYTNTAFAGLGYIWKVFLNETAKHPAFVGILPENDHNEIGAFERSPSRFAALFLRDLSDGARMKKRILLTERVLETSGVRTAHITLRGKNVSEKIWNGILCAEWTAMHLAKMKKVNPEETKLIERFKKMMGRG